MFFDETSSRVDIAATFKCNISQISKAVTGVHYKGGPHRYKPRQKQETKEVVQIRANKRPKNLKPQRHEPRHLKHQLHKHMKSKSSLKTHFRRSLTPALIFLPV